MRAQCAIVVCLAPLAFSAGCGSTPVTCAGTGVGSSTATVSIDIGDILKPEASATLHVGDELYVGSNSCGDYGLPAKASLAPTLEELNRHQRVAAGDRSNALDVTYRAAAPGQVVISISCRNDCPGSPIRVTVTVVASP